MGGVQVESWGGSEGLEQGLKGRGAGQERVSGQVKD